MRKLSVIYQHESKLAKSCVPLFVALICFVLIATASQPASASEPALMRDYAENLRCVGFEMRDEIKSHFKHSKGYGKMLGIDAQIRVRSAAVGRRVCRDACYRGLQRDVRKLNELTCELTELYEQAVHRSAQCLDRPIPGDTLPVADKLLRMNDLASGMLVLSTENASGQFPGTLLGPPAPMELNPYVAPAPGNLPEADRVPQFTPAPVPTPAENQETRKKPKVILEAPLPATHSILEK